MLESIIEGYKKTSISELKTDNLPLGEFMGSSLYQYLRPLTALYEKIKSYTSKN